MPLGSVSGYMTGTSPGIGTVGMIAGPVKVAPDVVAWNSYDWYDGAVQSQLRHRTEVLSSATERVTTYSYGAPVGITIDPVKVAAPTVGEQVEAVVATSASGTNSIGADTTDPAGANGPSSAASDLSEYSRPLNRIDMMGRTPEVDLRIAKGKAYDTVHYSSSELSMRITDYILENGKNVSP